MNKYHLIERESTDILGCWDLVVGKFKTVVGYTAFGDFFLQDDESGQIAILYTIDPELVPTNFKTIESFRNEFLSNKDIEPNLIRPNDIKYLSESIGCLGAAEVYIPEPYPFLGGDGSLDSYNKGNVWVFADLVGQMQDVGSNAN